MNDRSDDWREINLRAEKAMDARVDDWHETNLRTSLARVRREAALAEAARQARLRFMGLEPDATARQEAEATLAEIRKGHAAEAPNVVSLDAWRRDHAR